MKLTNDRWLRNARLTMFCLVACGLAMAGLGQAVTTTTVQGTVYLANGQLGAGTLTVSWPAFTTASGQLVAADRTSVTIGSDGFVSINLAPNLGALPAGEYYTAVFYMSDGTVNTQYWIVPAAAQATLAQVQAQVMPSAQAVQAVTKAYVDQSISELSLSQLTASGGNLTGPLYLNADPTQPLQAADKHYVDAQVATAVPLTGGSMVGPLSTPAVNGVEAPAVNSQQTTLQAAMNAAGTKGALEIPPAYAGTDSFTNPNGVRVTDMRTSVAQQIERSVKEFGAVCDGVTDDTNALQSAINYAQTHGVALTIPEGTCKTRTLNWHGESIGGLGKQVSALMGFPGQDVLATTPDSPNIQSYTRLHDLTIYVDQSVDVSCSPAEGRAAAGSCQVNRPMESNTIFSPGGNGLKGTTGSGAGWAVGNCAIAMQATTGAGGNGLKNAQIENVEIVSTGTDPMAAPYSGAHSTHTCGLYLAQWPQWSEFKNIDIRGLNTGVAIPALPVATPARLLADSNRWQNITIQATHGFTAAAGCNGVLDDVTAMAGNSAATSEPPTGIVLDLPNTQEGWTVRNAVVVPNWNAVQPALTVTAASGAVTSVSVGAEHGLGWDPYGTTVPLTFSGSCTAQGNATVNSNGSIGAIGVTQGGTGCSSTTTASINAPGNWDTAAPVNLIGGQNMTFFAGSLLRGHGGYTVWNATGAQSYGTQVNGGGGNLPGGGSYPAFIANNSVGSTLQVDQFPGANFGAMLQACVNAVNTSYGGTCDARNFTGSQTMSANLIISTPNTNILLPCATITTANQVIVTAGTRNVALRGCAMRGGSAASGSQGGTAFAYSGAGAAVQVGDPSYALDTPGFHMDNSVMNTTGSTSATAQGLVAYRTQEIDLEEMYFLGNSNQTGITLDGTGNYAGGTIRSVEIGGFKTAVNAIGHQIANPATTDWMNASTFVRLHIDCPTSNGSPIAGTTGINLQQGDGNTFTGGDVEGCATALHLGLNAQNNTIIGLRNENSTSQVVADAGSSYNNWITGGTMFTGQLTDNGTRNSFQDTFHRSFNGINGDWYGSQQDATVTNHFRLGTGAGNERGLLNEYQTDYGYRWTEGLSDATGGEQFYQILDQLNNVYRISIGQYNNGQSSTNNQTLMNSAGTGAVALNASSNSGTGGVIFGSGGASPATVATINNSGNAQFNGMLLVGGASQSTGTMTVRNNADAEVDYYLWPGLTASQKGSFTYKDWNGNSQWYMVKDSSNNWALNSAVGGLDSFKAYQSTNSGDTYIDASNSSGHIRLNYETGSGAETDIYSGSSSNLVASFLGPTSIKLPGLAAGSGHYCLQIDNSGYITNTGSACGSGSGGGSGTVNSGNLGQIAYYASNGTTVGGMNAVPVTSGGTGATSAAGAMANLLPGVATDGNQGFTVTGNVAANSMTAANAISTSPATEVTTLNNLHNATWVSVTEYGAVGDCTQNGSTSSCTVNVTAAQAAVNHCFTAGCAVYFPANPAVTGGSTVYYLGGTVNPKGVSLFGPPGSAGSMNTSFAVAVRGAPGMDVFAPGDPASSGYVMPNKRFSVRDLAIVVDNSVDASSSGTNSFKHRLPGRTVYDAAITASNSVLTSSTAIFQPGDAVGPSSTGQAVAVFGAGSQACPNGSGNTCLVTTIRSYQSGTQVTLAASASSTVSAAQAYISVMNLPVSQTIGNCAWAYDDTATSGGENAYGITGGDFTNVNIIASGGSQGNQANNTCAFFFQGPASPYKVRWEHDDIQSEFGMMFVPSDGIAPGNWCDGICDFNVVEHAWIGSFYPWLSYSGNENTTRDIQLSAVEVGPHILNFQAAEATADKWNIQFNEEEGATKTCLPGWMAYRIAGFGMVAGRLATADCTTGSVLFQWDAVASRIDDLSYNSLGPIDIAGSDNAITSLVSGNTGTPNVTGFGNQLITCYNNNPPDSLVPTSCQYVGNNLTPVNAPLLSRGRIAFNRTHDFIDSGVGSYYWNKEDLWLWPGDVVDYSDLLPSLQVFDTTSQTGAAWQFPACTSSCTNYYLHGSTGSLWYIGSQIPAGPMRVYFMVEAAANTPATTLSVDATVSSTDGEPTTSLNCGGINGTSFTPATSYGWFSCDVNTTGMTGYTFGIKINGTVTSQVRIAGIAIKPWNSDLTATGVTIGQGSKPMASSSGTGGIAQETTPVAKTNGNLAWYQNGNVDDSGIPSALVLATPSINAGDLMCAHGGDQTIRAITITGGSGTGSAYTLSAASLSPPMYVPGQKIGVIGSGVSGLDGGPYTVTSFTTTSLTFASTAAGAPTGGTFYLWCENSTDATASFTSGSPYFQYNPLTIPAFVAGRPQTHMAAMSYYTTASAPAIHTTVTIGTGTVPGFGTSLYTSGALTPAASLTGQSGQLSLTAMPLAIGSTGPLEISQVFQGPFTTTSMQSSNNALQSINTTATYTAWSSVYFAATGLGSITSGSGGTISSVGTCTLSTFNDGATGATATVTFATSGSWTGASFAVTNTGYGATAAPTTATLSSGTGATCSGTATLVTVLGGAQGNAVELISIQ